MRRSDAESRDVPSASPVYCTFRHFSNPNASNAENLSTYLRTTLRRTRRDRYAGKKSVKHRRPEVEVAKVRTLQPEQVNSLCTSRQPGIGCRKTVNQLQVRRDEQSPPPLRGTHIVRTSTAVSIISRNSPRVTDMAGASIVVNVRLPVTPDF